MDHHKIPPLGAIQHDHTSHLHHHPIRTRPQRRHPQRRKATRHPGPAKGPTAVSEPLRRKRRVTAREGAAITGVSPRQVRRLVALPRDEWLLTMATERESIRAFHD